MTTKRGPLLTFKDDTAPHELTAPFYDRSKMVALIRHGSGLLLWTRLSNSYWPTARSGPASPTRRKKRSTPPSESCHLFAYDLRQSTSRPPE
ncbi:MAG: hypothetical protein QHC90_27020 [Shinella sp.]|nr:hypothetical protein [Shinella sp.]